MKKDNQVQQIPNHKRKASEKKLDSFQENLEDLGCNSYTKFKNSENKKVESEKVIIKNSDLVNTDEI